MGKVGAPYMGLKKGYGKGKHGGNARAIANEALPYDENSTTRYCSDPDYKPELTKDNKYLKLKELKEWFPDMNVTQTFECSKDLVSYWEAEADAYRKVDKNGRERKLRSDASIGFAQIIKPDYEFMSGMSTEEQDKFLENALRLTCAEYHKKGIIIDCAVIHVDESNRHIHLFGHDPEYRLSEKIKLPFFHRLNVNIPEKLRQLGYDIESCEAYEVEATKDMTADELEAYKQAHIERKQNEKNGQPSKKFKMSCEQKAIDEQQKATDERQNARKHALDKREENIDAEVEEHVTRLYNARKSELERQANENEAKRKSEYERREKERQIEHEREIVNLQEAVRQVNKVMQDMKKDFDMSNLDDVFTFKMGIYDRKSKLVNTKDKNKDRYPVKEYIPNMTIKRAAEIAQRDTSAFLNRRVEFVKGIEQRYLSNDYQL